MNERTLRVLEYDKILKIVAEYASSSPGKELVMQMTPSTDRTKVQRLLSETDDAVSMLIKKGNPPLSGIHDMKAAVVRAAMGGVLGFSELLRIADILYACRNLKNYAADDFSTAPVLQMINLLYPERKLEEKIKNCIISEEEMADEASPLLSSIRKKIRSRQNDIKDILNEMVRSAKYSKYMQEPIVTMRGDRYVIPVRQEFRNEVTGMVHDASSSGATLFIEPMAVVEANNDIRQLKLKEQAEIDRILAELSSEIAGISEFLKNNINLLINIDAIFARAKFSSDYRCTSPLIIDKQSINIKRGRHPLIDRQKVVPVDISIGTDYGKGYTILVVTGPNTGGKTVTLKTAGLFTLMAQSGMHLPSSDGTSLGIFNNIFADIGDEQSIEQSLSTFSSHMVNISAIVENIDRKSLVLFDELGAGTDPAEGAALATAILEYTRKTGAICLATTHYSELKLYAISKEGVENACCEFDVETLKPTYRLLTGIPGKSNAFAISKRLGLKESILDNAKEFLTSENIRFEDIISDIERNRRISNEERMEAESIKREAERLTLELKKDTVRLEQQKDGIIRQAKEEARRILIEAKRECDEIIAGLKQLEEAKSTDDYRMLLKRKTEKIESELSYDNTAALDDNSEIIKGKGLLKPGASVYLRNIGKKGVILSISDDGNEAMVQVGVMKIGVNIATLEVLEEKSNKYGDNDSVKFRNTDKMHIKGKGKIGMEKTANSRTEIDLRGMTIDEAEGCVDKFLDDSSMAGLSEVFLIHGKGTGALRSGLHIYLKKNPHVKAFRLGVIGEGDSGVTLVQLK